MKPLPVGVVVVTHNSATAVAACLNSVRENRAEASVVVDNASIDTSVAVAQAVGVQVVQQVTNQGFASGCNLGARRLTQPFILFLNPDAVLAPGALAAAYNYMVDHPQVAVVGLGLVDSEGRPEPDSWGSEVTLGSLVWGRRHTGTGNDQPHACAWVSGGALLIRREVFGQVGGFDEQFFLYWEDVDLCRRVRVHGYTVVALPTATVIHERGASSVTAAQKTQQYDASADRYFRKHYATGVWLMQRFLRRGWRLWSPQVR
ncbi:MAG: glycosyltransferase family 2 protein [Candidatus Andersenbacteria bacterium]